MKKTILIITFISILNTISTCTEITTTTRVEKILDRVKVEISGSLEKMNLPWGSPVFMRLFKETEELELWIQDTSSKFVLFRSYPICKYSGTIGPKLQTGDKQCPEGFYSIYAHSFNPDSKFHLSMNMGYPNSYDRHHKRTGSAIMIHGGCVSIGCYAMTDKVIEEIYALCAAAIRNGQRSISIHAFPFRMSNFDSIKPVNEDVYEFWKNLHEGYKYFEIFRTPPVVTVKEGRYIFSR